MTMEGSLMFVVWEKLKRLQGVMRALNKTVLSLKKDILKAREDFDLAQ